MMKLIKKHGFTAIFLILLFVFVYYRTWWGVGGMFLIITAFQIMRLVVFFRSMPWLKELMLTHMKKWEAAQLGYDLDDDYWNGKKRPTVWQKLRGINPNDSNLDNDKRKQINKEITKQMSFKQKHLSIFDYNTGSKAIYLMVSITLAIMLIKLGLNLFFVIVIILVLGQLKKLIDKKLSK